MLMNKLTDDRNKRCTRQIVVTDDWIKINKYTCIKYNIFSV